MNIGIGDMVEYGGNGITVMIYARQIVPSNNGPEWDKIVDGNVMCWRHQVIRVVHTAEHLKESHERYMASIRGR